MRLSCYLQIQTVQFVKLKTNNVYEDFHEDNKICLILVTICEIQSFLFLTMEKLIGKMKDESKGKIIDDFIRLKSKMYFTKDVDGKKKK